MSSRSLIRRSRKIVDRDGCERGIESVSIITEVAGEFWVEVRSREPGTASYTLTLDTPRKPQASDEKRLRAEEASTEGKRLAAAPDAASQRQALALQELALDLWRQTGDRFQESATLAAIGDIDYGLNAYKEARGSYLSGLAISQQIADRRAQGEALNNIGLSNWQLGNFPEAAEDFTKARKLWKDLAFPYGDAASLTNIGLMEWESGLYQNAILHHLDALKIFQSLPDREGEAYARNNLAVAFESLADYGQAQFHLTQAIVLFHATKNQLPEGRARLRLARIYFAQGDFAAAQTLCGQALALAQVSEDRLSRAEILELLGQLQERVRRRTDAIEHYQAARALFHEAGSRRGEADACHHLGVALIDAGRWEEAGEALARALELRRKVALPDEEAETLYQLSRVQVARGNRGEAQVDLQSALEISERVRLRVPGPDLRVTYFASKHKYYAASIAMDMAEYSNNPAGSSPLRALETAERCRARILLDAIDETPTREQLKADPALFDRGRQLRRLASFWATRVNDLHSQAFATQGEDYARRRLDSVLAEYTDLEARIAAAEPHRLSFESSQTYSAAVIQRDLLDRHTVLLEYALGEKHSYLWVVTQYGVQPVLLPARGEIERVVIAAYALASSSPLASLRATGNSGAAKDKMSALSRLLIGPVAGLLSNRRLLIVGDGLVEKVPFAALPDPSTGRPLVASHEIAMLPSASTLVSLRRERSVLPHPEKEMAVFADPVYGPDDPRLEHVAGERPDPPKPLFGRLPFSRLEAEGILKFVSSDQSLLATGFTATREAVEDPRLAHYRFLHFAVHSLIDDENPRLSGIVLSLFSASGEKCDGFLRVEDIMNLKIGADLVVLSSCRSATPTDWGSPEGLATLAEAFFYAGSSRVVATLWRVDDAATAHFMGLFYDAMFHGHLTPCAALAAAQRTMQTETRFSDPYYWAGFVLQGEWL